MQYRLTVGNQDFCIDLLFYHLELRPYVLVNLKMKASEPEFAGKMMRRGGLVPDRG